MSDLPKGWILTELCNLSSNPKQGIVDGPFGSNLKASEYVDEGIPIIRLQNIDRNIFIEKNIKFITPDKAEELSRHSFQKGDIVVSKLGIPVGKACVVPDSLSEGIIVADVVRVRIDENSLFKKFIAYAINSPFSISQINMEVKGSTRPRVNLIHIRSLKIPLAPTIEQRRIVEKLEKLLGKVDACQKRLERIPLILKRFRQAVLAAACSGRLTADWREENPDVETASELFNRIQIEKQRKYEESCREAVLNGKRKPKNSDSNKKSRNIIGDLPDIPKTWSYFRLEDISHLITDGTHRTPEYVSTGLPFLSVKNVRPFLIRDSDIKFITQQEHEEINARCNPEKGDILYTKVGATFGFAAENKLEYPFSIFVSLALIKPVTPFFTSQYAEVVMNSEIIFSQARERVSGIGTPDLHLIEIRDFRAPFPPLEEQQEIVRRVDALFKVADQIEARYNKAKAYVDKLAQSILAKAFRGELVPQDPRDEPASVLLERIRAERAASAPANKKARPLSKKKKHASLFDEA